MGTESYPQDLGSPERELPSSKVMPDSWGPQLQPTDDPSRTGSPAGFHTVSAGLKRRSRNVAEALHPSGETQTCQSKLKRHH